MTAEASPVQNAPVSTWRLPAMWMTLALLALGFAVDRG